MGHVWILSKHVMRRQRHLTVPFLTVFVLAGASVSVGVGGTNTEAEGLVISVEHDLGIVEKTELFMDAQYLKRGVLAAVLKIHVDPGYDGRLIACPTIDGSGLDLIVKNELGEKRRILLDYEYFCMPFTPEAPVVNVLFLARSHQSGAILPEAGSIEMLASYTIDYEDGGRWMMKKIIVAESLTVEVIECQGYDEYVNYSDPQYKIPYRDTIIPRGSIQDFLASGNTRYHQMAADVHSIRTYGAAIRAGKQDSESECRDLSTKPGVLGLMAGLLLEAGAKRDVCVIY